jgi:hypothetical protein
MAVWLCGVMVLGREELSHGVFSCLASKRMWPGIAGIPIQFSIGDDSSDENQLH